MPLSNGTRLGPYEILAPIGSGGMGEVYKARDTRLDRIVAVKISAEQFSERFEREARAVAALNHPNICTLHDVGPNYLVMEYIEGPTLAERIAAGAIPLEEALPIARQIAEALEAAHEKGIVHRDLKPANIKLTPEGKVKVLDFGLAKAFDKESTAADPASSPTLTLSATRAGMILGTAGYMSPEQARGIPADKRADIWSYGVVLYEMLTGRQTFAGETVSDMLASVLKEEPDLAAVPEHLRPILARCLRKDRRRRWRDIGDVLIVLEEGVPAPALPALPRRQNWTWVPIAILAVIAATLAIIHFREQAPAEAGPVRFTLPPPEKGVLGSNISVSPDGRKVAFSATGADGATRLWIRPIDSIETRPLVGSEGNGAFWSPDGRFIAFQVGSKLKKADLAGGPPQSLCDVTNFMLGGSWSNDGVIIFGSNSGGLARVRATGGPVSSLTALDRPRQEISHADPTFLPDGRHFIYLRRSNLPENSGIFVGSLDARPDRQSLKLLVATQFSPAYVPPAAGERNGYLLFVREGTLLAQPFNSSRLEPAGDPVPLVEQVATYLSRASFAVSVNGVLAWRPAGDDHSDLSWRGRDGGLLTRVSVPNGFDSPEVALSPDGSRVAYSQSAAQSGRNIWLFDFARGAGNRLTFNTDGGHNPAWSADGRHVFFASVRTTGIYRKAANGAGNEELLLKLKSLPYPHDASSDGRFLLYSTVGESLKQELWLFPDPGAADPGSRKPVPFLQTGFNVSQGQFSPDVRWVAYRSDESGVSEVYVRPFPTSSSRSGQWLVSSGGGSQPRWRRDGKELFYVSVEGKLMAADVAADPDFKVSAPHALLTGFVPSGVFAIRYAVADNGKRFLSVGATGTGSAPITVVLNWQAGLKK